MVSNLSSVNSLLNSTSASTSAVQSSSSSAPRHPQSVQPTNAIAHQMLLAPPIACPRRICLTAKDALEISETMRKLAKEKFGNIALLISPFTQKPCESWEELLTFPDGTYRTSINEATSSNYRTPKCNFLFTPMTRLVYDLIGNHVSSVSKSGTRAETDNLSAIKNPSILELGAGPIDPDEKASFLISYLPGFISRRVTYVDHDPYYELEAKKIDPNFPYVTVPITLLHTKFPPRSCHTLLACSVFDTIPLNRLEPALQEAYKVLDKDGKLFIISYLPPFGNTLLCKYSDTTQHFIFPWVEKNPDGRRNIPKGIWKVLAQDFHAKVSALPQGSPERQILTTLKELSPIEREFYLAKLALTTWNAEFSAFMKELFGNKCQAIDIVDDYKSNMKTAIAQTPFKVEFSDYRQEIYTSKSQIINDPSINYVTYNHGNFFQEQRHVLTPGLYRVVLKVHVIILKKE